MKHRVYSDSLCFLFFAIVWLQHWYSDWFLWLLQEIVTSELERNRTKLLRILRFYRKPK